MNKSITLNADHIIYVTPITHLGKEDGTLVKTRVEDFFVTENYDSVSAAVKANNWIKCTKK